jgi:hypothetical protein
MSDLDDQLAAGRADPEFRARLAERMTADAALLQRLTDDPHAEAQLTEAQLTDWADLPLGTFAGASRYDTDDEHILTLWVNGLTFDVRRPRSAPTTWPDGEPIDQVGS